MMKYRDMFHGSVYLITFGEICLCHNRLDATLNVSEIYNIKKKREERKMFSPAKLQLLNPFLTVNETVLHYIH